MMRVRLVIAVGGLAFALSSSGGGKGGGSGGGSGVNSLAAFVTKTASKKSAEIDMRLGMTVPGGGRFALLGGGTMDLAKSRGMMSMRSDGPLPGLGSSLQMD